MAPAADEPEQDGRPDLRLLADADGELVCRIAEKDLEAFEILYRRYARPVYGLALRRLRGPAGAQTATQRAFAAIWRSAATYAPGHGGGARWLFTVARNAIADDARRAGPTLPEAPREPDPESVAEDGWPAFRVHAAVAGLPEPERVPLELAYWGGRSPGEIAELLGLPPGVVEARTRSALARLAEQLEELR